MSHLLQQEEDTTGEEQRRDVHLLYTQRKTDGEAISQFQMASPLSSTEQYEYNFCSCLWTDGHSHFFRLVEMDFSFFCSQTMLGQDSHLRIHFNLEGGSKHSIEHADFESCLIEYIQHRHWRDLEKEGKTSERKVQTHNLGRGACKF